MRVPAVLLLLLVGGAHSATEELFVDTADGKQLLSGYVVHDEFLLYIEKFIGEKLRSASSSIYQYSKVPFHELFSSMQIEDYILMQILHALTSEDIILPSFLGEITTHFFKEEGDRDMRSNWLSENLNFPVSKGYTVVKSLARAEGKDSIKMPQPVIEKILYIVNVSAVLASAAAAGDRTVVAWLLRKDVDFDYRPALKEVFVRNDRTDIIKLLIGKGALENITELHELVDYSNDKKENLLHLAAQSHSPKTVTALLKAGMKPDVADTDGFTPLHRSVEYNDLETVSLLVKNGADVDQPTPSGDTPLHLAVVKADIKMTKLLIKLGSRLSQRNNQGYTPIAMAESIVVTSVIRYMETLRTKNMEFPRRGKTTLSEFLDNEIEEYLDNPNMRDIYCNENDMSYMISLSEIVNLFLRKGEVTTMPSHISFLLATKATNIDEALSEIMINLGYSTPDINIQPLIDDIKNIEENFEASILDIDYKNETGHTHLHTSAAKGALKSVKALIAKGADLEASTNMSWTPLHFAASAGHQEIVDLLLKSNAKVNAKTIKEETPLHLAATNGHAKVVKTLLKNEADQNAETYPDCLSPLYLASKEGHLEVVKLVLANKAYVNSKDCDKFNLTPLQIASLQNHVDVVQYLPAHGADIDARDKQGDTALYIASWNGLAEVVSALLELGANPNLRVGKQGLTALHVAAERDHVNVVNLLLRAGVRPNIRDNEQGTPLYKAAAKGHTGVIRALLKGGANVNSYTSEGVTALHRAAMYGHADALIILLKAGADINAATADGQTPAFMAVRWNQQLALNVLIKSGANLYTIGPDGQTVLNFALKKGMVSVSG